MADLIQKLIQMLMGFPEWQILGITTLLLLEGAFFTIFPEEVIMCTLGILWSQGNVSFPGAWLATTVGLLPTNIFVVTMGRLFGMRVLKYAPFRWFVDPDMVRSALEPIQKYGALLAVVTRFTPVIRAPIYFSIGISNFPPFKFIRTDFLASLVQIPLWIAIGGWMGSRADSLMQAFQWVGILFGTLLLAAIAFKVIWDRRKRSRTRRFTSRK